MDRGYDNVQTIKEIFQQGDDFIIRLEKNRHLLYQNKKLSVRDLALRRKGKINFRSEIKGKAYNLKISHIAVEVSSLKGKKLMMVVVYGCGKDPMVLLTNKQVKRKTEVLSINCTLGIEEMFRCPKTGALLRRHTGSFIKEIESTILSCINDHCLYGTEDRKEKRLFSCGDWPSAWY